MSLASFTPVAITPSFVRLSQTDAVVICVPQVRRKDHVSRPRTFTDDERDELEDLYSEDPERYLKTLQLGYSLAGRKKGAYSKVAAELLRSGGMRGDFYVFDSRWGHEDIVSALATADSLCPTPQVLMYYTLSLSNGSHLTLTVVTLVP